MMDHGSPADELAARLLDHVAQVKINLPSRPVVAGKQGRAALLINLGGAAREFDLALHAAVALERERGASWSDVGAWLGMSKQAAWQRFGRHDSK